MTVTGYWDQLALWTFATIQPKNDSTNNHNNIAPIYTTYNIIYIKHIYFLSSTLSLVRHSTMLIHHFWLIQTINERKIQEKKRTQFDNDQHTGVYSFINADASLKKKNLIVRLGINSIEWIAIQISSEIEKERNKCVLLNDFYLLTHKHLHILFIYRFT